jgi:hypothetical protein
LIAGAGPANPRLVVTVLQNFVSTCDPCHCAQPTGLHAETFALSREPIDVRRFQLARHRLPKVVLRTQLHGVLVRLCRHPSRHHLPREPFVLHGAWPTPFGIAAGRHHGPAETRAAALLQLRRFAKALQLLPCFSEFSCEAAFNALISFILFSPASCRHLIRLFWTHNVTQTMDVCATVESFLENLPIGRISI